MTLLPWEAPDGTEMLILWLSDEFGANVSDERPHDAGQTLLPYRVVNDLGGPSDRVSSNSTYSIHTFHRTKPLAQAASQETHRRILYLAGQFTPQQKVTLSDGRVVQADDVEIIETPHWEQWVRDNSVHRYVATYRIPLRFVAAI